MLKDRKTIMRRLLKGETLTTVTFPNGTRQFCIGEELIDGRAVRATLKLKKDQPGMVAIYHVEPVNGGFKVTKEREMSDMATVTAVDDRKMVKDHRLVNEWLGRGLPIISTKSGNRVIFEVGPHLVDGRILRPYIGDEPFVNGVRTIYVKEGDIRPVPQPRGERNTREKKIAWEKFKQQRRAEIEMWRKSRK